MHLEFSSVLSKIPYVFHWKPYTFCVEFIDNSFVVFLASADYKQSMYFLVKYLTELNDIFKSKGMGVLFSLINENEEKKQARVIIFNF